MLDQPMSTATSRKLGRKAAAAFPDVSKARIRLYREAVDYWSSSRAAGINEEAERSKERPQAAAALLRQLQGLRKLQRMHLAMPYGAVSRRLAVLVPQLSAQHLQVLDLTEASHSSSVLPVIAAHLTGLHELVLPTLKRWSSSDIAALAALPSLHTLACGLELPAAAEQGEPPCLMLSNINQRRSTF